MVTNSLLVDLHLGYDESAEPLSQAFVPGTHQLLFSTEQFPATALRGGDMQLEQNLDLLLVDTDTGKIKQLQARGQGSAFLAAPDGKLWIWRANHIDVIGLDGKIVRRNLAALPPALLNMPITQWTQDLSEVYIMPLDPDAGAQGNSGLAEPRALWQYPTNGNPATEIQLSPPLMGYMFSISPDGNWVVYTFADFAQETQETATPGIYLGNLRDGTTQLIQRAESFDLPISPFSYDWSPDSVHFIFDDYQDQMYMGNVRGEITPLQSSRFIGWIDASRYLYGVSAMGEIGKEEKVGVLQFPAGKRSTDFTFVFVKK